MEEVQQPGELTDRPSGSVFSPLDVEILDRLGDAVLVTDLTGRFIEANLAAATMLGYSRGELLSMSVRDVTAWPTERIEAEFERFLTDGYWRGEVELRRKDGTTITVDSRSSILETPAGRRALAIHREPDPDLATLQAAERRLAAIVRSSDDAIYSVTPDGVIEAWNPAAERLFGYRAEEIVGRHVRFTAPPERHEEVQRNIDRVLRGEPVQGLETVRLAKDGRRIDVALTISPVFDPDGSVTGMSTIGRDISERIAAERWSHAVSELARALEDVASSEGLFEAALDALQRTLQVAQAGFLLTDGGGTDRFRAWRGLSAELREALEQLDLNEHTGGVLTVPDVDLDRRLSGERKPFERAGVRSLMRIPLAHLGSRIGAAIVCFDRPRMPSADEQEFSVGLCGQVSAAVTRLRAEEELAAAQNTLRLLTVSAGDGITIQDADGVLLYANLSAARLTGFDSVESFLAADPRDRIGAWEMFDEEGHPYPIERLPGRRVVTGGEREAEAVMLVRDRRTGHSFWSLVKSTAALDERGEVRYAINIFHDITTQKEAELTSQLRAMRMTQLYGITATLSSTTDGQVVAEALADMLVTAFGASRGGVVVRGDDGSTLETIASRGFDADVIDRWRRFTLDARTPVGQAVLTNEPVLMPDRQMWVERYPGLEAETLPAAAASIPLDIGGRAIGGLTLSYDEPRSFADDDVGFMLAAARQGALALERSRVETGRRLVQARLSILARAGDLLAQSLDYPKTLSAVADLVVPRLADWASVEILESDGVIHSVALAHVDPERLAIARDFRRRRPPELTSPTGIGHVITTGQPELVPEITEEMLASIDDPEVLQLVEELKIRSVMLVPLRARGRTLGAMSYVWAESDNRYSSADLEFAQTLAARMALVIDNARLYRDRDHIARTLQQSLLPPDLPDIEGVQLAARYHPSGEGLDVGGDFYDAFEIGDGEWTVSLGDVCGKGPDAAALMGMIRHTIRAAAIRERAPARVLATVNTTVARQTSDEQFCTAVAARLRPQAGRLSAWIAVAGHPRPLVRRTDGSTTWVPTTGALLGVFDDAELTELELSLVPGDVLVLYTDGVSEVRDEAGQLGEEGVAAAVARAAGGTASEIADAIEEAVREKDREPRDDIAILVVRVTG